MAIRIRVDGVWVHCSCGTSYPVPRARCTNTRPHRGEHLKPARQVLRLDREVDPARRSRVAPLSVNAPAAAPGAACRVPCTVASSRG
jgi:hypothetical protein